MKKEEVPTSLPKIDERSREKNVNRQTYLFVEINQLIRKRIREDRMTTADVLGVLRLAEAKLTIDSLRPQDKEEKQEEAPSYFG